MTKRKKKEAEQKRQEHLRKRNKRCSGKKSYDTEMEADGYARMWSDPRYGERGKSNTLSAYFCPMCNKWHLTSKIKAKEAV